MFAFRNTSKFNKKIMSKHYQQFSFFATGLFICFIMICAINVTAQESNNKFFNSILNLNGGIFPLDLSGETGDGVNLGMNYCYNINERFALEANLGFLYKDYSTFPQSDDGDLTSMSNINLLLGGRYYFNNIKTEKHHFYTNLLIGTSIYERMELVTGSPSARSIITQPFNGSIGVYAAFFNRITLGVSMELVGTQVLVLPELGINIIRDYRRPKSNKKIAGF